MKIKYLLLFTILLTVQSCGPKPWPNNIIEQMRQTEALGIESKFLKLVSNTEQDTYLNSVLSAYKEEYPDYAAFEKALINDREKLVDMRVLCMKRYAGYDINSVWKLIEDMDGVRTLRNQLSGTFYLRYKTLMMGKIKKKYPSMSSFIDEMANDEYSTSEYLMRIDKECGQIISKEIKEEHELQKRELQNMKVLNSLFDDYLYNYGYLNFTNKTSKTIILVVAYYYYGQKWKGWVSDGWWNITPGSTVSIKLPLNEYGSLNRYIYYCAKNENSSTNFWGWSGDESFLVMDENFKIPNADLSETKGKNRSFRYLNKFKKIDIGTSQKDWTLNLTE